MKCIAPTEFPSGKTRPYYITTTINLLLISSFLKMSKFFWGGEKEVEETRQLALSGDSIQGSGKGLKGSRTHSRGDQKTRRTTGSHGNGTPYSAWSKLG